MGHCLLTTALTTGTAGCQNQILVFPSAQVYSWGRADPLFFPFQSPHPLGCEYLLQRNILQVGVQVCEALHTYHRQQGVLLLCFPLGPAYKFYAACLFSLSANGPVLFTILTNMNQCELSIHQVFYVFLHNTETGWPDPTLTKHIPHAK